jgi:alpha-glucosidase
VHEEDWNYFHDPEFLDSLAQYEAARGEGREPYMDADELTDIAEYFAEGVQDWFNVNAEMDHPDGKHNYVNTRDELKERDPGLYELLAEYFPATDQQISKHKFVNECTKENSRTH